MSQRVNITYSVEIDQLDIEVQRLIKSALSEVQTMVNDCNNIEQAAPLTVENCQLIDRIRQKLAKADIVFADVNNIINGYLQYQLSAANESAAASDISQDSTSEDISALKNKIEMFKESLTDNQENEVTN